MNEGLSERAQHLLHLLIQRYIREGEPVASKTLAADAQLNLSSATIRNIMAELEDHGLLISPHTSSGRVPTQLGYRLFVDSLLTAKSIAEIDLEPFHQTLEENTDTRNLVSSVSNLLSNITQLAGIITIPKPERAYLRQVEFISLSANRVLVILVLNEDDVQNRIIQTTRAYQLHELQEAANYINANCLGIDFEALRPKLLAAMRSDQEKLHKLLQAVLDVAEKSSLQQEDDFVIAGQGNLFNAADGDVNRLRFLFEAFNQKRDILHLLDQVLGAEGVQIFIGEEAGYKAFDTCSLVTAPYTIDGMVAGVLGVIGPTRMSYERVIPIVDITAKLLSAALKKSE